MTGDPLPPDDAPALVDTVLGEGPRVVVIGRVSSPLTDPGVAPKQGDEGGAEAWVVFGDDYRDAARDLTAGAEVLGLTWLHRADRDPLVVHPSGDPAAPLPAGTSGAGTSGAETSGAETSVLSDGRLSAPDGRLVGS